ncbi:MAG: DNA mismatch repair protein MutS [Chitinophagaceae bacterium]
MSQSTYQSLLAQYTNKANTLNRQLRWLSFVRLVLFAGFIFLGYKAMRTGNHALTAASLASFLAFFIVLRFYDRLQQQVAFYKALVRINGNEIAWLSGEGEKISPITGSEHIDPHHPYSYDLDIFGSGGLLPYLNRTSTAFGQQALARALLQPDKNRISDRQEAVKELAPELEFRQHLQAHGLIQETKEKELQQLKAWVSSPPVFPNKAFYYFLMIFPLATLSALVYYFFSEEGKALNLFLILFTLNLAIAFSFSRKIAAHLSVSTSVNKVLQQFASQLKLLESHSFSAGLLKQIQAELQAGGAPAWRSIARLASLFNYLETVINLLVSVLLNGFFLFHIHILFALEKWKQQHGHRVMHWLHLLGEAEALASLGNLSYNNPLFCFPQLRETPSLAAVDMGHPLIRPGKRIANSISFDEHPFVILTGSNMSGKSTFLRTLGINLVLANAGSAVCATQFHFYPFEVQVSMRISDSLQDSESFFYAELKRLQHIIRELEAGKQVFVILDEILRGTNSNDKHSGTIGLIRNLVAARACGIIATHDLTVSRLAGAYPAQISNKCFESQIVQDELLFNYRLEEGVCTTLSASFLMKKMGIIRE